MEQIMISKTFLPSNFFYSMQRLAISEYVLKRIEHILDKLIGKKEFSTINAFEKIKSDAINAINVSHEVKMIMQQTCGFPLKIVELKKKALLQNGSKWVSFPFHEFHKLGVVVFLGKMENIGIQGFNLVNWNFRKAIERIGLTLMSIAIT